MSLYQSSSSASSFIIYFFLIQFKAQQIAQPETRNEKYISFPAHLLDIRPNEIKQQKKTQSQYDNKKVEFQFAALFSPLRNLLC